MKNDLRATDLEKGDAVEWGSTAHFVTAKTADSVELDGTPFSFEEIDTYCESDSINFRKL